MAMVRRSLRLTESQDDFLHWLSARTGTAVADLLREMIDERQINEPEYLKGTQSSEVR